MRRHERGVIPGNVDRLSLAPSVAHPWSPSAHVERD
jgi:hypothetical protein